MVRNESTQQVTFRNLPQVLAGITENWSVQERWESFHHVLECSVAIHATIAIESRDARQSIINASSMRLEE